MTNSLLVAFFLLMRINSTESIHRIIHPVFNMAVRDENIRLNPASGAIAEIKRSVIHK